MADNAEQEGRIIVADAVMPPGTLPVTMMEGVFVDDVNFRCPVSFRRFFDSIDGWDEDQELKSQISSGTRMSLESGIRVGDSAPAITSMLY